MPTVVITGANRGLGLEFVRQYAADGWTVIAACRNPIGVGELAEIDGDIQVYGLHVTDPASIDRFASDIEGTAVDVLINNAGVYGPKGVTAKDIRTEDWMPVLETNVMAPLYVSRALIGNLAKGERKLIVTISSVMGSVERGAGGTDYIYRSSKAAVNMVMAGYAQEIADTGVASVMFHPGWVQTDMGGAQATLTPTESISELRKSIAGLTFADTGTFKNYDGTPMPW